ncbi:hypothetical protein [Comamonas antarctica]|uniref:hypothetical protein n=1 Tax=Comamonas antarctica TaxID=2743470 RepID=UPI0028EDC727|nr:hypothetical protein [Comamonas antarctica]
MQEKTCNWFSGSKDENDMDSNCAFADILSRIYSRDIQQAVARELGLQPGNDQPPERHMLLRAIAMAEASRKALRGVDFMTQLMFSAAARSAGFTHACHALGLSPQALSAPQRAAIDACMAQRFIQAARRRESPVAPWRAQQWLLAELMAVYAQIPDAH